MTVLELLTASMHRLGYLEATETPTDADAQACKAAANDWIDALALEEMFIYRIARSVFNLSAGVASYTIGTGATFNVPRPVSIERCGVIIDPAAATPVETPIGPVLTVQQYAHVGSKSLAGLYPTSVYYDPTITSGYGTIHVHPVPSTSTPDLVLYLPERLTEFDGLADDLTLPAGYRRFFVTNIAMEVAPILGATPTTELATAAFESKAMVQRANVRPEELLIGAGTPGMGGGGFYNINLG